MSELRRVRIVTDDKGFAHLYVAGTDIEIDRVVGLVVRMEDRNGYRPVAELTLIDPEIDVQADVEIQRTIEYRRMKE